MKFLTHWLATAIAAAVAVWLLPGIYVIGESQWIGIVFFALTLSLVDTVVKPALKILSFPITILTLGLSLIGINILMIYLAANVSVALFGTGIAVSGVFSALAASIVIGVVSAIMSIVLGGDD